MDYPGMAYFISFEVTKRNCKCIKSTLSLSSYNDFQALNNNTALRSLDFTKCCNITLTYVTAEITSSLQYIYITIFVKYNIIFFFEFQHNGLWFQSVKTINKIILVSNFGLTYTTITTKGHCRTSTSHPPLFHITLYLLCNAPLNTYEGLLK